MTTRELITKLEELEKEHGTIPVKILDDDYCEVEFDTVEFGPFHENILINVAEKRF